MQILQPATWVYDCKCECGAHFIATDHDFVSKNKVLVDHFGYADGTGTQQPAYLDVLTCPYCSRFITKKLHASSLLDRCEYEAKEVISGLEDTDSWKELEFYTVEDQSNYNKIKVELKKWFDIPELLEKYKRGGSEL